MCLKCSVLVLSGYRLGDFSIMLRKKEKMHGGYINKGGLSVNDSMMPLRSLGQHLTPLITLEMSTTSKCIFAIQQGKSYIHDRRVA